jgi:GPH family glycoside/pentoside/hexuronide:cation symporter
VADEDELRSGVRREGAFFGINAMLTKPAQSLAIAIPPFILEAAHFVSREANQDVVFLNQPASAIFGIKVFIGLIPGIAMLLGALILFWFPLRGARLEKMQSDLLELHAKKRAEYEKQNA